MINRDKVTKSSQVDTFLPLHIRETYKTFIDFMITASEADERVGFSQDLLQNLLEYRNFDTYQNGVIKSNVLKVEIEDDSDEIILEDGFGFPETDGIVYIDDEIILFRERNDNVLSGLLRGASGTIKLPTLKQAGVTKDTEADKHNKGAVVKNLSVLFMSAMLETIHESFAHGIPVDRVDNSINRSSLLQNIKDFFQSKGTELGIKSLFKILFAENDVKVEYPGQRMIIPSDSSFAERFIIRVTPIPDIVAGISVVNNIVDPDKITNQLLSLRSYNDDELYGTVFCDYSIKYPYGSETSYELWLSETSLEGDFISTPRTKLTRDLIGTTTQFGVDNTTITVESTINFPSDGFLFIGEEMISYESKTFNQFLGCKRGIRGVEKPHDIGDSVSGPYYVEASYEIDGTNYVSRNWVLGLVGDVRVREPGLLHTINDNIIVDKPGRIDDRDVILRTVMENVKSDLAEQNDTINLPFIENLTSGVSGLYFDKSNVFVTSTNWPQYPIGPFTTDPDVKFVFDQKDYIHIIPRRESQQINDKFEYKGDGLVGMFVDGVPALSNEAPIIVSRGKIASYKINLEGEGYKNPTVVIDPPNSTAKAVVVDGRVVDVVTTNPGLHEGNPDIKISSGEGAVFSIQTDKFGRITEANVISKGRYYNDAPSISVTDLSGKGRGAVLRSEVANGEVVNVVIEHSGIDYRPDETTVIPKPIGSGALVDAIVEYFTFDRLKYIESNSSTGLDAGNGTVVVDETTQRNTFGYVCSPNILRYDLNDVSSSEHSPIIGWAYDGNPIYGPYAYRNGVDGVDGIARMTSGYKLRGRRSSALPRGYEKGNQDFAYAPPAEILYPMGTFIEDYFYDSKIVVDEDLNDEKFNEIFTERSQNIVVSIYEGLNQDSTVLDENNGKVCNTPDFPKEFYPDGVYCYFVTVDFNNEPEFPYIIGKTFHNLPISQNLEIQSEEEINPLPRRVYQSTTYESPDLTFDLNLVDRYRNNFLYTTNDEVDIRIGGTTIGGVSGVEIEDGTPSVYKIGDRLQFESTVGLGDGANGEIIKIKGETVLKGEGTQLVTRVISHTIEIDLSPNKNKTFVFVKDTFVRFTSGSYGRVESYNHIKKVLTVVIETHLLPTATDCFHDNRGQVICLSGIVKHQKLYEFNKDVFELEESDDNPSTEASFIIESESTIDVASNRLVTLYDEPSQRPDGSPIKEGDLWWSPTTGRLYIYYNSDEGSVWVNTQPIGMRPFNGALDIGIGVDVDVANEEYHKASNNTITISLTAPSKRPDGSPNAMGDLWFSPQTGILYLWHSDLLQYAIEYYIETGELPTSTPNNMTMEWVCTDPAAMKPFGNTAANQLYPDPNTLTPLPFSGSIYSANLTCIISEKAPLALENNTPITVGTLWWSSANGKMFVYYDDGDSVQWVITNPYGALSSSASTVDEIVTGPDGGGDGGNGGDPIGGGITVMPEPAERGIIWFHDLTHFLPDDFIEFDLLSPAIANEQAQIKQKLIPYSARCLRGTNGVNKDIPNNTPTYNQSRTLYTVFTDAPHRLSVGDSVDISGSRYEEVNGIQEVVEVGHISPATLEAVVDLSFGQVVDINIIDGGRGYENDFLLVFSGGGGIGASAIAHVSPRTGSLGGSVTSTSIVNNGENYTSEPNILISGVTDRMFSIYLTEVYPPEMTIEYSASHSAIQGDASEVKLLSTGTNYEQLPKITGVIKKEEDQPVLVSQLNDLGGISRVDVTNNGSRLISPRVKIYDNTGSGSGAEIELSVVDGLVASVTVINSGENYVEPIIEVIDEIGKFVPLTDDIGQITSFKVLNPGRNISSDRANKPEVQIDTRLVIKFTEDSINSFTPGQLVYQGSENEKFVSATVLSYEEENQVLLIEEVNGIMVAGENVYNGIGTKAMVLVSGQSDSDVIVTSTSKVAGQFLTEKSMVSRSYAVIQDSYYYQNFSYLISSSLQETFFDEYVKNIIHPSGFIMFSEVIINTEVSTPIKIDSDETISTITITQ